MVDFKLSVQTINKINHDHQLDLRLNRLNLLTVLSITASSNTHGLQVQVKTQDRGCGLKLLFRETIFDEPFSFDKSFGKLNFPV